MLSKKQIDSGDCFCQDARSENQSITKLVIHLLW